jgi:hypothetical protein
MFFSRAFTNASSALIVSTYFPASTLEAGVARGVGLAWTADATGGAALS